MLRWLCSFVRFQLAAVISAARRQRHRGRPWLTPLLRGVPIALYAALRAVVKARFGRFPPTGPDAPKATVVLLSWRRAPNVNLLAMLATRAPFVERVIVSNNDPDARVARLVTFASPKLVLIDQPRPAKPGIRVLLALADPGELFIFLDDDVFPTPVQLARPYEALLRQPEHPHGYAGLRFLPLGDASPLVKRGEWETEVQMLFRLYLCSRAVLD